MEWWKHSFVGNAQPWWEHKEHLHRLPQDWLKNRSQSRTAEVHRGIASHSSEGKVVDHLHVAAGQLVRRGLQGWAGAALQQRTRFHFTTRGFFIITFPTLIPRSLALSCCTQPGQWAGMGNVAASPTGIVCCLHPQPQGWDG